VKSGATAANRPAGMEKVGSPSEVDRGPRGKNQIALTFDAGAEAECFDDLLTALANAHASSTFFITGKFVHDHADCAAEITKHGHEVGNHTWSHLNLTQQFSIDRITSKGDAELDGAIILLHVGVRSTADALPAIISNLQARGFQFVTVSKLLQ
jgi:peptidoglycan/xylan/chitin deacetylase (PgdA/CDA1 family)